MFAEHLTCIAQRQVFESPSSRQLCGVEPGLMALAQCSIADMLCQELPECGWPWVSTSLPSPSPLMCEVHPCHQTSLQTSDTSPSRTQRAAQRCQFHTRGSPPPPCSSCTCPGSDTSHLDCCNKSKALPHHPSNCKDEAATLCHPSSATE